VDELVIGVLVNSKKTSPLFTMEERLEMIKEEVADLKNVRVESFDGMTIDFARNNGAKVIIRGLRAVTDFESEMALAQINHSLDDTIDTMFFTTSLEYAFLSSTMVKEVASYKADISKFVSPAIEKRLKAKFN
jgi:pantetheine-phosphate adenylyltransferase